MLLITKKRILNYKSFLISFSFRDVSVYFAFNLFGFFFFSGRKKLFWFSLYSMHDRDRNKHSTYNEANRKIIKFDKGVKGKSVVKERLWSTTDGIFYGMAS